MTLPTIELDDLDWAALTQSSRESIAGASNGQWTLHAPVDPGVTLLELFASHLEQRLFWMDAPSESLDAAILKLHGIQPQPVKASRTVFTCEYPSSENGTAVRLNRHSVFEQHRADRERRFQTLRTIDLLPFKHINESLHSKRAAANRVGYLSPDRMYHKPDHSWPETYLTQHCNLAPLVFQPTSGVIGTRFRFELREGVECLSIEVGTRISFLFDLETPRDVDPQWSPSKNQSRLRRAGLVWRLFVERTDKTEKKGWSLAELPILGNPIDGTRGMVRSGIVELRTGSLTVDNPSAVILEVSVKQRSFSFLPRFKRVLPNSVVAENRVRHNFVPEEIATQLKPMFKAKLPGSQIDLSFSQDQLVIPDESLKLRIKEELGNKTIRTRVWRYTRSFSNVSSTTRVFTFDRSNSTITFGDGIRGRIPRLCLSDPCIEIRCDIGGGSDGNIAKDRAFRQCDSKGTLQAFNPVPAVGGTDEETSEAAFRRLRRELASPSRSVTKEDLESLCVNSRLGIGRAQAIPGMHPHFPTLETPGAITVLVLPDLPESLRDTDFLQSEQDITAIETEPEVLRALATQLDKTRLLGDEIFVRNPAYVPIDVRVTLSTSNVLDANIRNWLSKELSTYLHPIVGGPNKRGWPIGQPVIPSELQRVLREHDEFGSLVHEIGVRTISESHEAINEFETCVETSIPRDSLPALRDIKVKLSHSLEVGVLL